MADQQSPSTEGLDDTLRGVEALDCPKCGAGLEVPEGLATLKCRYCGSTLRVVENSTVRGLALVAARVEELDRNVKSVRVDVKELQSLTRDARLQRVTELPRTSWAESFAHLVANTLMQFNGRSEHALFLIGEDRISDREQDVMRYQQEGHEVLSDDLIAEYRALISKARDVSTDSTFDGMTASEYARKLAIELKVAPPILSRTDAFLLLNIRSDEDDAAIRSTVLLRERTLARFIRHNQEYELLPDSVVDKYRALLVTAKERLGVGSPVPSCPNCQSATGWIGDRCLQCGYGVRYSAAGRPSTQSPSGARATSFPWLGLLLAVIAFGLSFYVVSEFVFGQIRGGFFTSTGSFRQAKVEQRQTATLVAAFVSLLPAAIAYFVGKALQAKK